MWISLLTTNFPRKRSEIFMFSIRWIYVFLGLESSFFARLQSVLSTAFSNYLDHYCLNSYIFTLYSVYACKSDDSVLGNHYALDNKCLVDTETTLCWRLVS